MIFGSHLCGSNPLANILSRAVVTLEKSDGNKDSLFHAHIMILI
jgi:hypothetical protein